jgi:transposase
VRGLADAGFEAVLMETRQVRAALSSTTIKTDRNDARGMAHLLRMGWFRPVHVKSMDAREQRVLLSARTTLVRRLRDIENRVRGLCGGLVFASPGYYEFAGRRVFAKRFPAIQCCSRSSTRCSLPGQPYATSSRCWKSGSGTQHDKTPSVIG